MLRYFIPLFLVSSVAFAKIDSSINVPVDMHQKYTLSEYSNHPTLRFEGERYLASLAKISKEDVGRLLLKKGLNVSTILLLDLNRELVYEVYAKDTDDKKYRLYVDAGNGDILQKESAK